MNNNNIIKHENTTRNIRKLGDVANLKFRTFNKNCYGLTGWCSEIPASAYCHPLQASVEKPNHQNKF